MTPLGSEPLESRIAALERKNRLLQEALKQAERIRELWGKSVQELKLAKAELRASRGFLDRVLGAAPEPIVVTDAHGRIVLANAAAERIAGFRGQLAGRNILRVLPRDERRRALQAFTRDESDAMHEFAIPTAQETRLLAIAWSVLRDPGGRIAQVVVAGQDVTERRRAELQIMRQSEELQAINANLSVLYEVSSTIGRTMDIDELYSDILKLLPQVIGVSEDCERGIFLVGNDKELKLVAQWGAASECIESGRTVPRGECLCGRAAADGRILLAPAREDCTPPACGMPQDHGCVVIPLKAKGEVIGVSYFHLSSGVTVDQAKTKLLVAVGEQIGVAIENVRLYEEKKALSLHDPLTGLANRRYLEIALTRAFANAKRYRSPLSVLMLDIDYFKKYNDSHGHQAGDLLLSVTAQVLSHQIREADLAARYGGEEFLVILPETDLHQAKVLAERIRVAIAKKTGITVSVGISDMSCGVDGLEKLIQRADGALYRAKQNGRDRTELALQESSVESNA